jgi:L-amino acid N-acyltransferase YncA
MEFTLHEITEDDWKDICVIYFEGIATGNATFETDPPATFEEWMDGKLGTIT